MKPVTAVQYFGRLPVGYGNLMFDDHEAVDRGMRGGTFPPGHPGNGNPRPVVFGRVDDTTETALGRFRRLGYLASCFPEGDGIAFDPPEGRTHEEIVRDVEQCFGWKVTVVRR